jgi:hypothetical protein
VLKFTVVLIFCQILFAGVYSASAEDYQECRLRCEADYTDCTNEAPAPEPEVQNAKMGACNQRVASCYADCENLMPVENPAEIENNPNIIRK